MLSNEVRDSSVNYVKSEEPRRKKRRTKNSGQPMLIKLAIGDDKKGLDQISSCCQNNGCIYIPFHENKFGILTDTEYEIARGQETSKGNRGYNIKKFIDVYNCAKDRSLYPFHRSKSEPYASILLDNQYYMNLIEYCKREKLNVNYILFANSQGTHYRKETSDEIDKEFNSEYGQKAIEINLTYADNDIIIKKNGYVIIESGKGTSFYDNNKKRLDEIISVGFKNKHG